jgi:type VI secretion system secreted protein VgrG
VSTLATNRNILVITPLPEGTVALERMDGHEALGQPFVYELSLLSTDWAIDLSKLIGHPMTVTSLMPTGDTRYFNGIVTRASHLDGEGGFARYSVTLQPWLWLLDTGSECRIFQNSSVPDIIMEVFRRAGFSDFEDLLDRSVYKELEYCVQYRESDFNFVSRLMEHEGIYYFFKHDKDKHTLVLVDSHGGHSPRPGYEEVEYRRLEGTGRSGNEHLSSWVVGQQIRPGGFAATDYDFKLPRAPLLSQLSLPKAHPFGDFEVFDYPGDYLTKDRGDARVRTRLQERQGEYEVVQASGDVRGLGSGDLFTLVDFRREDQNKEYLVVSVLYTLHAGDFESTGGPYEEECLVNLTLIDANVPYRPPLRARKTRVEGPQTAVVVGESGAEISTDKYGRVKVQFHWDRYGMSDERSSCFVRVAQVWAGAKWGAMYIPRIGHEVVVDFLEGDPDRPIITGSVYNGVNMPPYLDPNAATETATQSGIKSHSTPGGGPNNYNEIKFEDKKGKEELHIQAERDQSTHVKHNQSISVDGDRSVSVGGNESISVTKKETQTYQSDRKMTVTGTNTDEITKLHSGTYHGGRTEIVETHDTLTVSAANKKVDVDGQYDITAKTEFQVIQAAINKLLIKDKIQLDNSKCKIELVEGVLTIKATDQIKLECGGASITLAKTGEIAIVGSKKVSVNGAASTVELAGPGATVSGPTATMSGKTMTEITGLMVKIN